MILLLIAGAALAAWLFLAFARGFFWRARERLALAPAPAAWPAVAALIPARNEAETIAAVIASHAASDYPGAYSVLVVDDASDDGTADLARAAAGDGARKIEVIAGAVALAAWLVMATTYLPTLSLYRLGAWQAFTLPAAALLYTLMTLSSALRHLRGGGGLWKGRTYP